MYWNDKETMDATDELQLNSNIRCIEMPIGMCKNLDGSGWIVTLDVLKWGIMMQLFLQAELNSNIRCIEIWILFQ